MSQSIISVIGKDRVGIVYNVSKLLAENQINIVNISQQLLGEFFSPFFVGGPPRQCSKTPPQLAELFAAEGKKLSLEIRIQNEEIFHAMHRI